MMQIEQYEHEEESAVAPSFDVPVAERGCEVCGVRPGRKHRVDCLDLWEDWPCREHGSEGCGCPIDERELPSAPGSTTKAPPQHFGPLADVSALLSACRITHHDLDWRQERELVRLCQLGDQRAFALLLQAHERLLYRLSRRRDSHSLGDEDLLQEARAGFAKGVRRFDLCTDYRLTTYATWWARQSVTRAIQDHGSVIRLPNHLHEKLGECRAEKREPQDDLADYARLLRSVSLDVTTGEDGGETFGSLRPDEGPTPEEQASADEMRARRRAILDRAMVGLSDAQRDVLRRRFADDHETLERIGDIRGVSRERIRQIEREALWKLGRALKLLLTPEDRAALGLGHGEPLVERPRWKTPADELAPSPLERVRRPPPRRRATLQLAFQAPNRPTAARAAVEKIRRARGVV